MEVNQMQKKFAALMFVSVFLLSAGVSVKAQVSGPPIAKINLPDLVISEIKFEPSPDQIRVRVFNQGSIASSACYLALLSGAGNAAPGTQRVWSIQIPGLEPGKGFSKPILVAPLTQANGPWKAVIDRSNSVKESNEDNNQLTSGESTGNPAKVRLPDLKITRAVLIDSTEGEVSVEVKNTETGTAGGSTLRLIVWEMGKFEKKSAKEVFVKVPAIEPLQKVNVKIKAGVPIISTRYSLYIDIGNDVAERNEQNNRYEGEAGKS